MKLAQDTSRWPAWQKLSVVSAALAVILVTIVIQAWPERHADAAENIRGDFVWKCSACGHEFELSESQMQHGGYTAGLGTRVMCPSCKKQTGRLAEVCPNDGTCFFPEYRSLEATPQDRCPQCGWSRLDDIVAELRAAGIEPPGAAESQRGPVAAGKR